VSTRKPLICLFGLFILLQGCSKQDQDNSAATSVNIISSATAEEVIKVAPKLVSAGKAVYERNCIFCHQADAIGKPGFAPSLTNPEFLSTASDKFLMGTIRDGRAGTGMPPFAHLGRADVEAVVAYLRSHAKLPNISARIDAEPHTQGDERLGKVWFEDICSTCHGPQGDGYIAGGTGTAIGKTGFLSKASDGFIRETIKNGRSNTRMLGFSGPAALAALSERDINDIIAYLRTVPSRN